MNKDIFEKYIVDESDIEKIENNVESLIGEAALVVADERRSLQYLRYVIENNITIIANILTERLREFRIETESNTSVEVYNMNVYKFIVYYGDALWNVVCNKIRSLNIKIKHNGIIMNEPLIMERDSYILSLLLEQKKSEDDDFVKGTREFIINIISDRYGKFIQTSNDLRKRIVKDPEPTPTPETIPVNEKIDVGDELIDFIVTMSALGTFQVDGEYDGDDKDEKLRLHNHLVDMLNRILSEYGDETPDNQ